jgi:hypothetical protein
MEQARATHAEQVLLSDADLIARVVAGEAGGFVALMQRYDRTLFLKVNSGVHASLNYGSTDGPS